MVTGNKSANSSSAYVLIDYLQVIDSNDSEPPTSLEAPNTYPSDSSVTLIWNACSNNDFEGYNIYRSTSSLNGFQKINKWIQTSGNSFNDSGLVNGTNYYYRITAVDNKGNESNPSTAISVLPALYAGTYEESAGIAFNGTWDNPWDGSTSGSYYKRSKTAGDTIDIYFYGTSVKWTGYKSNYSGSAEVTLDEGTTETIDLYNPSAIYKQTILQETGLTNGLHHLSIKVLGTHSAGNDNWVNLDTIEVKGIVLSKDKVEEKNITVEYTGLWDTYTDDRFSNRTSYSTTNKWPDCKLYILWNWHRVDIFNQQQSWNCKGNFGQ